MDCSNIEQAIQLYIDDKLTGRSLSDFLEHIEGCHSCYEEMEINFLIKEALLRLEDGTSFDLRKELLQKLAVSKRCLEIHRHLIAFRQLISIVAYFSLLFGFISVSALLLLSM